MHVLPLLLHKQVSAVKQILLKGAWATGKTLEECRINLKDVVEGWILLSIKKGLPIPKLGDIEIREIEEAAV